MKEPVLKTITGREISALLNPRLAVLVTCCDGNGKPNVLTVVWHTPLSHVPPLVGISIRQSHYSHELIRSEGEFVVNVIGQSLQKAAMICGAYTGEINNKLEIAKLETYATECVRPPLLAQAIGWLECRLVEQVAAGDHTFFIGRVLLARAREECFDLAWKSQDDQTALLCLQRDRFGSFLEGASSGQS